MLSKGDDYPLHQTPDPIAFAGSDRNFYDRYFFNGYSRDGAVFFGAALGVYPQLNIMDAAFSLRIDGVQHDLNASRHLGMERMDTRVGPIAVEVVEPLQRLRITVDSAEHGIRADILFEGRFAPAEEPRAQRRNGPRILSDFTRMSQFGRYSGWVEAGGRRIHLDEVGAEGVRDRSWGLRAVGERDPQPMVPAQDAQFHWVWLTAQFADRAILVFRNEDTNGDAWNSGTVLFHDDGRVEHPAGLRVEYAYRPGGRWPQHARIVAGHGTAALAVEAVPGRRFLMNGLGYLNPDWGHGVNKGPLAVGYRSTDTDAINRYAPPHIYTQALCAMRMRTPDGTVLDGMGTLETLSFGPHALLGLTGPHDGTDAVPRDGGTALRQGDAHVRPHDGTSVRPHDGANVHPHQGKDTLPHDGAGVRFHGGAGVLPHDSASVPPHDDASVPPHDDASVLPHDDASVLPHDGTDTLRQGDA